MVFDHEPDSPKRSFEQPTTNALTKKQEQWSAQNRDAINAYNEQVQALGVFSESTRSF